MGLFLGLGLLGAAFAMDGLSRAPYDRAIARLERKYGRGDPRCDDLQFTVQRQRCFEKESDRVIGSIEYWKIMRMYGSSSLKYPYDAAVHDIAKLAAVQRNFEYTGYRLNVYIKDTVRDEDSICYLGIIDSRPGFSARRWLMAGRILSFDEKNNGKLKTPFDLFEFLKKEGYEMQELYNAYAQKFPDTFEDMYREDTYLLGLQAALNYEKWKSGDIEPKKDEPPKLVSLVTGDAPSNVKLWDD